LSFNTVYSDLECPFCKVKVTSGVGFQVGAIENKNYKIGDKLNWDGSKCRPSVRPHDGNIKSIGYFNCDNIRCSTWQDCYPQIQQALVTVENDIITDVCVFHERREGQNFDIIEPNGLS
jgi:hypothetical protein